MPAPASCCNQCTDTEIVEVPGVQGLAGADGDDGTDGVNAYTTTTANFVIPAIGATVASVGVADNSWMVLDQTIFAGDGTDRGTFTVATKTGTTVVSLTFLGASGDSAPGATVDSGAIVAPAGRISGLSVALPTAFTDNSTGIASDTIAAGVGIFELTIPHTIPAGTAVAEIITNLVLGFRFKILSWSFVTDIAGEGVGASRVYNMEIGAVDVGTVPSTCTLTLASTSDPGELTAGTAVSGAQTGSATDTFSIQLATGGTAFTAGSGFFVVRIQNMDTADAVASLADLIDDLILSLT